MAIQQTNIPLLLTKGNLANLWSNQTLNTTLNSPSITNGQIYIGLDQSAKRAMLFVDDNSQRYVLTADLSWNDIRNIPTNIVYQSALNAHIEDFNNHVTRATNSYLLKSGDTMTGALNLKDTALTFSTGNTQQVSMEYNSTTDSLDFMFT